MRLLPPKIRPKNTVTKALSHSFSGFSLFVHRSMTLSIPSLRLKRFIQPHLYRDESICEISRGLKAITITVSCHLQEYLKAPNSIRCIHTKEERQVIIYIFKLFISRTEIWFSHEGRFLRGNNNKSIIQNLFEQPTPSFCLVQNQGAFPFS